MYQLTGNANVVIRLDDGASIPLGHPWWTVYQQWLAAGNTPAPHQTLVQAQAAQSDALALSCQAAIYAGFASSALGTAHTYPSTDTDQRNLQSAVSASIGAASTWTTPLWCAASGAWALASHTAAQAQQVNADWLVFRVAAQQKYASLVAEINAATTVAAVQAVVW